MPGASRLGDKSHAPSDSHGCPACSHPVTGPAVSGSADVLINGKPALRMGDNGVHSSCCGANTWQTVAGSATVFINGMPAVRLGDATQHCGGPGTMIEGSGDVLIGDGGSGGITIGSNGGLIISNGASVTIGSGTANQTGQEYATDGGDKQAVMTQETSEAASADLSSFAAFEEVTPSNRVSTENAGETSVSNESSGSTAIYPKGVSSNKSASSGPSSTKTMAKSTTMTNASTSAQTLGNFDQVTQYIYDEMVRNYNSSQVKFIHTALGKTLTTPYGYAAWYELVRTRGKWDHKFAINPLLGGRTTQTLFQGTGAKWFEDSSSASQYYSYDVWSNIHYGFIGLRAGFSEDILLDAAGYAQKWGWEGLKRYMSDPAFQGILDFRAFDDPADQAAIELGFMLYRKYADHFTVEQFRDEVRRWKELNKRNSMP